MELKMKWPLLMLGVVAVAVAATLLPIRFLEASNTALRCR
jgi:hypothetical protein